MRNVGSILLLIILVPITVGVFLIFSLQTNLFTSHFIKHELAARNAYVLAEDQASQQIAKLKLDDLPVDTADLQALARRVLSASWLQQNVEGTLDRAFTWFNGPASATLSLPIDLRGPKAELIPGVEDLIQASIPRLTRCAPRHSPTDLCLIPNMTVAQVEDILKQNGVDLQTITTQLPDSFDLANPVLPDIKLGQNEPSSSSSQPKVKGVSTVNKDQQKIDGQKKQEEQKNQDQQRQDEQNKQESPQPPETFQQQMGRVVDQLTKVKIKYHQGLQYWMDALIIYAVLILGYLAINIKGWRRLVRWLGVLLLTTGLLPLVISIATKIVLEQILLPLIHFGDNIPANIQSAILAVIRDVQRAVFSPMLFVSATMVVVGIAAIIGAHFISRQKKPKHQKAG